MAEKPDLNPDNSETPHRRRGRPTRQQELQRALAELGVDPGLVDPRRILAAIAGDSTAPAGARVAACRALMAAHGQGAVEDSAAGSDVASRAIRLMAAARKAH